MDDLFASMYDEYFDDVYRYVYVKTGNKWDTEDIVSDTFRKAEEILANFNIDIAFITVNGLSLENGLTDFRIHEVGVIQTILSRTKYKVVVADSSKFETSSYINVCPLKEIDLIVTDCSIPSNIVEDYNKANIRILSSH
ncbi:hypothetical protein ACIQ4Z_13225 [Peribacillus asahii]|uniref:hypothetical protein n=1 Tax=Peribacillus asahii TaxID=228899 RepID=UPI00381ACF16